MRTRTLRIGSDVLSLDRTRLMGVVNVTPDSFSDGGSYLTSGDAISHALQLAEEGADILDIGGESTRPGSEPVSLQEELDRVVPVVEAVASRVETPISVDTTKAAVARECLARGARIINDVSALRADGEMVRVLAASDAPVVLMHALWPPKTMQRAPSYVDVVEDVAEFLEERIRYATAFGISPEKILVDPGIGFGKTLQHNIELLKGICRFMIGGRPVVVGPSRKRFLGELTGRDTADRLFGTAGAVALLAAQGVHIIRVHDVAAMKDVVRVVDAVAWDV